MPKLKRRHPVLKQHNMPWAETEAPTPSRDVIPLDFETHAVRMVMRDGQPWWVAADVCRALGIENASDTLRKRLDDDEKGVETVYTPGGEQQFLMVNEPGLYSLVFASTKPEAKRFKRWITHEVLPTLRKTGTYSVPSSRVTRLARRLKIDHKTAEARVENIDTNKRTAAWLADCDARPREYAEWHNAPHKGMFGKTASELRAILGLPKGSTPLDRMGRLPLLINSYAKGVAETKARVDGLTVSEATVVAEQTASATAADALSRIGPDYQFDVIDHGKRGPTIDIAHRQLAAS